MKNHLIAYFIFLPLILLAAFTDIGTYLKYLAIASIPVSVAAIIYAFIRTKDFYNKTKKALVIFVFGLALGTGMIIPTPSHALGAGFAGAAAAQQIQRSVLLSQQNEARKTMSEIGRIPESLRTPEQQRQYEQARDRYLRISELTGIFPCPTSQELHQEITADCWSCDIANLFIEAGDKVATQFYKQDKQYGYSVSLLVLGLFFWILTHVMKLLMTFGRGDIGAFFTALFNKLLLVGGIFILLTYAPMQSIVNFAISPFFLLSATISQEIAATAQPLTDSLSGTKIDVAMESAFSNQVECKYCEDLKEGRQSLPDRRISNAIGYNASLQDRVVSPTMRNSLLCTVCTIYKITVQPTVTGQFLYCGSKKIQADGAKIGKEKIYSDWTGWIVGIALIFAFFLISAMFSFYLIDTFFRICFVLVLLPFLIVSYAFESTRSYLYRGMTVIIHATATYIIVALFMTLAIQAFYVMLGSDAPAMVALTSANKYDALRDLVGFGENGGRIMLACIGVTAIVIMMMQSLDRYIADLTGINLSNSGGTMAMMSTVAAGMAVKNAVSDVYSAKWKNPLSKKDDDNNTESKAAKIRDWGEDKSDGKSEKAVDSAANTTEKGVNTAGNAAANGVDKAGTKASKGMFEGGKALCKAGHGLGAIIGVPLIIAAGAVWVATKAAKLSIKATSKVLAKTSKWAVKYSGRAAVKAIKFPVKAIARNKYFNKTVGLFWQMGSDTKHAKESFDRYRNKRRRKKAARQRYNRRRKRK